MVCNQCNLDKKLTSKGICFSCKSKNVWAKKERTIVTLVCKECKTTFTKQRSGCVERIKIVKGVPYKYKNGLFCGRTCFIKSNTRRLHEIGHPTLGKTWRHTEEYKKKLSESRKGVKNPSYKHGAYSGIARRGVQQPQKEWRRKIYQRDNFICQHCGKKNGDGTTTKLNAHHICPWGVCEELRFDLSNGITLCIVCHKHIHDLLRIEEKRKDVKTDRQWYTEHLARLQAILEE